MRLHEKENFGMFGKVLVIDDVETNLFVAKRLLGLYNLQIETFDNAVAEPINSEEVNSKEENFTALPKPWNPKHTSAASPR